MGVAKATLPFGPEVMLARVVRLLAEVVDPIIVVAAPEQDVPALPDQARLIRDRREGRGPLEGIAAGLAALEDSAERAYVTSCDVPLLAAGFIRRVIELGRDHEIAVPQVDGHFHPLAAVYHISVLEKVNRLLAADRLRPFFLFDECDTRKITADELTDVDPQLDSLKNLNRPDDYLEALKSSGFEAPPEILRKLPR